MENLRLLSLEEFSKKVRNDIIRANRKNRLKGCNTVITVTSEKGIFHAQLNKEEAEKIEEKIQFLKEQGEEGILVTHFTKTKRSVKFTQQYKA